MAEKKEEEAAKPEKPAEAAPQLSPEEKAAKMAKIINVAVLAINTLVMAGGLWFLNKTLTKPPPIITEETETAIHSKERELRDENPVTYTFDPFTINLNGFPRKFLQTTIMIELLDESGFEEVVVKNAVIRDQILRILNSKTLADIDTIQGKLFLKDQIVVAINNVFTNSAVKEIYFTNFIVQ